jgi:hypothetical protein
MLIFEDIVRAAREATQLPDPDRDTWQEGLEILLRDHVRSGLLTERGEQMLKGRYVNALANRMRVDDHIRQHPEVLETPIQRPVIILGLVRTGTTVTSYLMDVDPANRSLLRWEANNVAPPAVPGAIRSDERCLAEKVLDEEIIKNNPEGVKSHFEPANGPTECVHLLAQDFRSMMFMAMTPTPIYADWILDCDMRGSGAALYFTVAGLVGGSAGAIPVLVFAAWYPNPDTAIGYGMATLIGSGCPLTG